MIQKIYRSIERRTRHYLQKNHYKLRPALKYIKNNLKGPIIGAEIGTFKGENAYNILKNIPNIKTLYLVDPYELYEGYTDFKTQMGHPAFLTEAQRQAHKTLNPYNDRVKWVQSKFEAKYIPEQLDFIYIDGQHTYEAVMHDIIESEKLVKKGGVIGGHDYYPKKHHLSKKFGVGDAVRDYYGNRHHWRFNDWWVLVD